MESLEPDLLQRILLCRRLQAAAVAKGVSRLFRLIFIGLWLAARGVVKALKLLSRWYHRNEALAELRAIEPRIQKDTGLYRADLWDIADAYARGVPYVRDCPPYDPDN